jgi:hypothetical protein
MSWFWIVDWWVGHLAQDVFLLLSIAGLYAILRPRDDDSYFERDPDRVAERKTVKLEEVERFIPTDVTPDMKVWCVGMRLPPEPIILENPVDTASELEYTRIPDGSGTPLA